jgi:hypothetical protein
MECISSSDKQTESSGSMIPVIRLSRRAPKKRSRRAYFQGSSNQPIDEMRVEIDSDLGEDEEENKTENQTEGTERDADTAQELTAEAIALLNENSSVPDTMTR